LGTDDDHITICGFDDRPPVTTNPPRTQIAIRSASWSVDLESDARATG